MHHFGLHLPQDSPCFVLPPPGRADEVESFGKMAINIHPAAPAKLLSRGRNVFNLKSIFSAGNFLRLG